jgi:NADH:ubiquinone oxidoreductase subunit 2 (subunit N)
MLFSFAGVPPLFGFTVKLIVFLLLISSSSLFYVSMLSLFNFFTLYFYIQNVRYIVNNSSNNYYLFFNNFVVLSDVSMFISIVLFIINIFGILYISDLYIFLNLFTVQ